MQKDITRFGMKSVLTLCLKLLVFLFVIVISEKAQAAEDYPMKELGFLSPGGSKSSGRSINGNGQVVGIANASISPTRAFLWDPVNGM